MDNDILIRTLALCVVLAGVETLHGIARTVLVVPRIGKARALRWSIVSGSLLAFGVCFLLVPGIGLRGLGPHLGLGLVLAVWMASFDIALGRLLLRKPWHKIWPDFQPRTGNLLLFGLLFLAATPALVWLLRAPAAADVHGAAPGVQWDAPSTVHADFNGDGYPDLAQLGTQDGAVVLGIGTRQPGQAGPQVQLLRFRVDADAHDGVCTHRVTLQLAKPACLLESGPLAGCDASRSGAGLRLGDERCDAIHLYWNFQTGQMAWWRH
jgi:hypothetical protein